MFKLGNPPRQLECFGVAGLLDATGEVFHQPVFSSRHIGTIADLLVARLRDEKLDELRFRAIMLFGLLHGLSEGSAYPARFECGIDGEKIAFGLSFAAPSGFKLGAKEAQERLEHLRAQADGVLVRYARGENRVEIVAMLGIPGKLSTTPDARAKNFAYVELTALAEAPAVRSYTLLGDLDHQTMLADEQRPANRSHQDLVGELEAKIAKLEKSNGGFLRSLWPFGRKSPASQGEVASEKTKAVPSNAADSIQKDVESEIDVEQAIDLDPDSGMEQLKELSTSVLPPSTVTPDEDAEALAREFEVGGFNQLLRRVSRDAAEIKAEIQGPKARSWFDGFMGDMLAEKARLLEMVRQVRASVKQREHECSSVEKRLLEEVRLRDELLKQRSSALARAKEQLTLMASNASDRSEKSGAKSAADAVLKQKYEVSQLLLASARKENSQLRDKISDSWEQIKKARTVVGEFAAMKSKHDRAVRQLDEVRKANQLLQERIAKGQGPATPGMEEFKKKLDAANRNTAKAESQCEQLQLRVEELQREEARLKKELLHARKGNAA